MRLERWEDNSNKKTFINIHLCLTSSLPKLIQSELPPDESSILKLLKSYLRSLLQGDYPYNVTSSSKLLDIWPHKIDTSRDNPNKETLVNINDSTYSHSLVVPVEKLVWGRGNPRNILDVSVPSRAHTQSTIWYLQRESKPNSEVILSCERYPVNGALPSGGTCQHRNMEETR